MYFIHVTVESQKLTDPFQLSFTFELNGIHLIFPLNILRFSPYV